MIHVAALLLGFCVDLLVGDPPGYPHIVVGIGKLITGLEKLLRKLLPDSRRGLLWGGGILVALVCTLCTGAAWGALYLCGRVHVLLALAAESYLCWQCIALRALKVESSAVQQKLEAGDLEGARVAVGRIVGRETKNLDAAGVTRAAVETVAENASDGVIAPLFYLALGGAPLGILYKAVNTMDSMVGYRNARYEYFGKAAARLDDALNLIPARLCALLSVLCAPLAGLDGRNGWRIYRRDRRNHKSPNAAHPEAAYAGALHLRLGGDNYYDGALVQKPTIGEDDRPIEPADIARANRLLYWSAFAMLILALVIRGLIVWKS